MQFRTIAVAFAVAFTAAGTPAFSGPSLSSNWTSTTLAQDKCMARAERIVRQAGMSRGLEIVGQSVFGRSGSYTAVVRCVSNKGIVFFFVAGPRLERAKRHMRSIFEKF
jgi:hypothetical protein